MIIKCPECDGKLKVPDNASARKVRCPTCSAIVALPENREATAPARERDHSETGRKRESEPSSTEKSATPSGKKKKKKKKSQKNAADTRLLVGIGAGGLLLLVVLGVILVRSFGGNAPQQVVERDEPKVKGVPLKGGLVVFSEPLVPAPPGPEKRLPPPPPAADEDQPLSSFSLLPPAKAPDATAGERIPWTVQPDPAESVPEPLPSGAFVHLRADQPPVLASLGAPFVLQWNGNLAMTPDLAIVGDESHGALPLEDLRTGKAAGHFAWKVPLWAAVRLSPDGRYLVGPDNHEGMPATSKEGLLFVWERDKAEPVARIQMPGGVTWMDFVAADKIGMLTFNPDPVFQVWGVTESAPEQTIPLPAGEFAPPVADPATRQPPAPGTFPYLPDIGIGTLSPGGHYVALAGTNTVYVVSLSEGKVAGSLPMPKKRLWPSGEIKPLVSHGLAFTDTGEELFGLLKAERGWLLTWSMGTGRLTQMAKLDIPEFQGPPLPGPEPNSVIIPVWRFDDGYVVKNLMTPQGRPFSTGAVIDSRTGAVLAPLTSIPLRRNGEGLVAVSTLNAHPNLPFPPGINPELLSDSDKQRLRERWVTVVEELDRNAVREQLAAATPPAVNLQVPVGDRGGLAASKPSPPASWSRPPEPPPATPGLIGAYNVPNTAPLFGSAHVGFISNYIPPDNPKLNAELQAKSRTGDKAALEQLKALVAGVPRGIHWLRYDLRTGQLLQPPVKLEALSAAMAAGEAPDLSKTPLAAAMSLDGARLAVRDPIDFARVDILDAGGATILTFMPYDSTPVQWVGWSAKGRLLTVGDGKLTGWQIPEGKAAFEVEGGYRLPVRPVAGNAWLAVAAGPHIDLVDPETGNCLGRCPLDPQEHDVSKQMDLALTPDGRLLTCLAWRTTPAPDAYGVVTSWDLTTGKASKGAHTSRVPGSRVRILDGRRVLLGSAVFDVQVPVEYVSYGAGPLSDSPDGRIWSFGPEPEAEGGNEGKQRVMLRTLELPGYDTGPTDPAFVFTKETPIEVEVEMGTEQRSRKFGENLLRSLQNDGFKIGKGGWKLRATGAVQSSDTWLTFKSGWGGAVNVPLILMSWKLYAPDGELAHTTGIASQFGDGSKYYRGQKKVSQKGIDIVMEYSWEFDRDPRDAMLDELLQGLETKGGELRLISPLCKFQGKYDIMPMTANAVFPPVPAPPAPQPGG